MRKTPILIMLIAALAVQPCLAQNQADGTAAGKTPGENLTIKVAVLGPGDELYFWWGHIALIIDDAVNGQSHFYDYGIFSFTQEHFFLNFARGRLMYSTGVSPSIYNFTAYMSTNRDITVYTLNLPPEKRELVRDIAEHDVLPENRDYLYHHFKDNCATPIIRIIDAATDGQFKERFSNEAGRFTLRQHVRRHTWFSPFSDWLLNFLMGQGIDLPVTVWDEMFLPSEVARNILSFEYADSQGVMQPLVLQREEVFMSEGRHEVLEAPRSQWPRVFAFGLAVSVFLLALFFVKAKKAIGRVVLGICNSLLGLVFGGAGLTLFFMSFFTEHDYTYDNANLFFTNPLLLALIPLGITYATADNDDRRRRPETCIMVLWLLVLLGVFASMMLKLTPWLWQDNLAQQLLMLPIALVLSLGHGGLKKALNRTRQSKS